MLNHVRRNGVAYLALFVALSGTSYAATSLGANTVGSKQLKKNAVTTAKIKNGAVTGSKINLKTLGTVPSASTAGSASSAQTAQSAVNAINATNASNANTVGGNTLGFAHVTFSGSTASVDSSQSSAGVSVTKSTDGTSCVSTPFTPKAAFGSVDWINDFGSVSTETLEASVISSSGHYCSAGQIEVATADAYDSVSENLSYYLFFIG